MENAKKEKAAGLVPVRPRVRRASGSHEAVRYGADSLDGVEGGDGGALGARCWRGLAD